MTTPSTKREASASQLSKLLERMKAATGPDHEINLLLGKWQKEIPEDAWVHSQSTNGIWSVTSWANGKDWGIAKPYTASIDAALALVEKMLPGWHAILNWRDAMDGSSSCVLHEFCQPCRRIPAQEPYVIMGRSTPLAILAALLQAPIAKAV